MHNLYEAKYAELFPASFMIDLCTTKGNLCLIVAQYYHILYYLTSPIAFLIQPLLFVNFPLHKNHVTNH